MKHVYAVYNTLKLSEQNNINKYLKFVHGLQKHKDICTVSQVFHKTLNDAKPNH